jgi:hypothetical protein
MINPGGMTAPAVPFAKFVQQILRFFQIFGVEASGEPAVDRGEEITRFPRPKRNCGCCARSLTLEISSRCASDSG